jgi:hypothetical protein
MDKIQEIKDKIRTINPNITDELLDLLYEYVITKYVCDTNINNINDLQTVIDCVANPLKYVNKGK